VQQIIAGEKTPQRKVLRQPLCWEIFKQSPLTYVSYKVKIITS